jgi:hypothetical protein
MSNSIPVERPVAGAIVWFISKAFNRKPRLIKGTVISCREDRVIIDAERRSERFPDGEQAPTTCNVHISRLRPLY